jgi:hypothetical protein
MSEKTEDSWIKSNTEYVKLRSDEVDGSTPRHRPRQQAPGKRGHDKPDYSRWTTDELRSKALKLGVEKTEAKSRAELLDAIAQHDAAVGRRR